MDQEAEGKAETLVAKTLDSTGVTVLTPEQASQQLDAGSVLLIDVGEAWQLGERGIIAARAT